MRETGGRFAVGDMVVAASTTKYANTGTVNSVATATRTVPTESCADRMLSPVVKKRQPLSLRSRGPAGSPMLGEVGSGHASRPP
ncbi:hypothetical protein ACWGCW_30255 [Streptomyces sp. NPDC054933]